jgi:hypothetical protein
LWNFVLIQVAPNRSVWRCSKGAEYQQGLIFLNQFANHLQRLRRTGAIVAADEIDPAPVDAALIVEHAKIGGFRLADRTIWGGCAAVRTGIAKLDLGVADAWPVSAFGPNWQICETEARRK